MDVVTHLYKVGNNIEYIKSTTKAKMFVKVDVSFESCLTGLIVLITKKITNSLNFSKFDGLKFSEIANVVNRNRYVSPSKG